MRQHLSNTFFSSQDICRFFDFDVVDRSAQRIGNVSGLWQDPNGRPTFIAVKTPWLFGKVHIIPLQDAQVDPEEYCLYVPYEEDDIKSAPAFSISDELTPQQEREIWQYYGTSRRVQEAYPSSQPFGAEKQVIPIRREETVVEKENRIREAIRVRKTTQTERENISEELHKEDVEVLQGQNRGQAPARKNPDKEDRNAGA